MTIAGKSGVVPLEFRLSDLSSNKAHGLARIGLTGASVLKRIWWYTRSYLPILSVLLLALGSLIVLQFHWLYRRLLSAPAREKHVVKHVVKDAG